MIVSFGCESAADRRALERFVAFHWTHYRGDPRYVPLLDYEYLGSRLLGITGFFEARNLFFSHGDARFFLALRDGEVVGRCNAFVNHRHNAHAADATGFFGNFECVDDEATARSLLASAEDWVRARGMTAIRGPQNFPVNEATPGFLIDGFDSRPVVYYHFNKPFYAPLVERCGYRPVMHYLSWECDVQHGGADAAFGEACAKVVARSGITIEPWGARPYATRRREMFEVYNDAWHDNFGFVPFTEQEFFTIVDDMRLIMKAELFVFVYVHGELAAFFGGVPNLFEALATGGAARGSELLRAARMLVTKSRIRGFRLGYLGVKRRFRRLGLDAVALWRQQEAARRLGYEYCDLGWVLETNHPVIRMAERFGAVPSKRYALFEKTL
ncbi:MAG TPA: hypothetical protein VG871_14545 [Vicinamibacterales bacterium]|nr:hypothetical protein [Vicinamibacterales bacterium]